MTIPLTPRTYEHIASLFGGDLREPVAQRLQAECGENLPLWHDKTPEGLERIRFAVLKLSAGELGRLDVYIREAQLDWRDVLVAADFADDVKAHLKWSPGGAPVQSPSHQADSHRGGSPRSKWSALRRKKGLLIPLVLVAALLIYLDPWGSGQPFDAIVWREANTRWSDTADYPRRALADGLIKRGDLIGLTRSQTRAMLGEPHSKDWPMKASESKDHYLIGPERFFLFIDDEWLYLAFDDHGRVERVWLDID